MQRLTIITVNLNNREGLKKTIESVLSQSYPASEFIIVDGGSTDGSTELLSEYLEEKYPRDQDTFHGCRWKCAQANITGGYFDEPDKGIYQAMNKGISRSTGEYILFLNSGDFLVDEYVLEKVFESDINEDIVACDCLVSQNGKVIYHAIPPDQISFSAFYGRTIPHQSTFIRKDLFDRLGYYNENNHLHSDYEFFVKALIVNYGSYRHLPVTVSDYNLEGLSSSDKTKNISTAEFRDIIQRLIPQRIIIDYENWEKERHELKPWYWVKRKPILYNTLMFIYKMAGLLVKMKKKKRK